MPTSQRRYITNGDVQLALERHGDGPRHLLFAHGWISSRRMWDGVVALLGSEYTAWSFDFRGCGESDRPREGHDLDGYASDLRAAISAVGEPLMLVAHSMGGRLAQYVASSDPPPALLRLLLVAPGVALANVPIPRHRALTERAFGSRRRIEAFQRGAMVRELDSAVMDRLIEDALIAQYEHWFGWYDRGRAVNFSERLAKIRLPVDVLAGAGDPLIAAGRLERELLARIPGSRLEFVRGAGHNLPVEAPGEVHYAIEALS